MTSGFRFFPPEAKSGAVMMKSNERIKIERNDDKRSRIVEAMVWNVIDYGQAGIGSFVVAQASSFSA